MTEYQRWRICTRKRPLKYKQAISEANRKRGDGITSVMADSQRLHSGVGMNIHVLTTSEIEDRVFMVFSDAFGVP